MSRPKFHKLYFPGLISLVFLPVMCICYFLSNNTFHKYQMMRVAWADKQTINRWINANIEAFRKYKVLALTGNSKSDDKQLANLQASLNQLFIKNDTVNGIKVLLGSHTQYSEFVNVLDICFEDKDENLSFDPIGNEIFIVHVASHPKSTVSIARGNLDNDEIIYTPKQPFVSLETIKKWLISAYKTLIKFWPSVLIFILMLYFTVYKRKRYLNLRKFHLFGN